MSIINFDASWGDHEIIKQIAERAVSLGYGDQLDIEMDLTALHCNGMPLDLEKFRDADDFNFTHDVLGIADHLNRRTGRLYQSGPRAHFVPRCVRQQGV